MTQDILVAALQVGCLAVIFVLLRWFVNRVLSGLLPTRVIEGAEGKGQQRGAAWYARFLNSLFLWCFLLLCIALIGANSYIIFYRSEPLLGFQLALLSSISPQVWQSAVISLGKCLALALVVKLLLRFVIRKVLFRIRDFVKDIDGIPENDASVVRFFRMLDRGITTSAWVATAIACLLILNLPDRAVDFVYWLLGVYLTISLGLLTARVMPIAIDTLDALSVRSAGKYRLLRIYGRFRDLVPLLKRCLELIIYVLTTSLVLRYSDPVSWLVPYVDRAARIIAIYFLTRVALSVVEVGVAVVFRPHDGLTDIQKQRRVTIVPLIRSFAKYAVYILSLVGILGTLGVDLTPILAGVGILGLAIGFGAQNLVEDIVSGLFVLFENYYLVGDYIAAGRMEERPVEGVVEAIELRTTRLRHPDGQVQIIRNGEIGSVVNYSKQFIYATVDIPLAYEENLDAVYPIILEVGAQLQEKKPEVVLEPTKIEGLESLGRNLVLVRTITKVKPGRHLSIRRELLRMLKDMFDQKGIELAEYEPDPPVEA